jgi:hypothetical protein
MGLGSGKTLPNPGSTGQKGTGSRIRNTEHHHYRTLKGPCHENLFLLANDIVKYNDN